jgi:hypothetical protein
VVLEDGQEGLEQRDGKEGLEQRDGIDGWRGFVWSGIDCVGSLAITRVQSL